MTHYLVPAPVVGDLCFLSVCLNIINEDTNSSQGEALWSISDPETASDFIREVKGRCFLLKLPDSLTGWRSPGQSVWARVHAHHFTRGQSDHPQERRRLLLYRRWWTHTHSHTHSSLPDTPPDPLPRLRADSPPDLPPGLCSFSQWTQQQSPNPEQPAVWMTRLWVRFLRPWQSSVEYTRLHRLRPRPPVLLHQPEKRWASWQTVFVTSQFKVAKTPSHEEIISSVSIREQIVKMLDLFLQCKKL